MHWSEAVARNCSVRKVFLKISQNSKTPVPYACNFIKKETLAEVFSCEFGEISRNTFSYRTPPVAASDWLILSSMKVITRFTLVYFSKSLRL